MHSQCRDIGPEWSEILPYLVTLLLHTENWKQNFMKRGKKHQWNFNYSPVHSGTMVNHKSTHKCALMHFEHVFLWSFWCSRSYGAAISFSSFPIHFSCCTVALRESLFLQFVLIEPVYPEQVVWQEPDSENQTEPQYSRFDSQISKLAKKKI